MRQPTVTDVQRTLAFLSELLPDRFNRKRRLGPRAILSALVAMALDRGATSVRRGLILSDKGSRPPSTSAFCRARAKLPHAEIHTAFRALSDRIQDDHGPRRGCVNGLRLVAIDGSQLNLPRSAETLRDFGTYRHRIDSHQPQARLVLAWDVNAHRPIDWIAGPCFQSEREAAIRLIPSLPNDSLVLLDRGFHGIAPMQAMSDAGIACFMRVRGGRTAWKPLQEFATSGRKDAVITITGTVEGELRQLAFRAIKGTRRNRDGSAERWLFITNLTDRKRWPRQLLINLYRHRWAVETAYRELKLSDRLESFHSRTTNGVLQEIAAHMITRLIGSLIASAAIHLKGGLRTFRWDDERRHVLNHIHVMDAARDVYLAILGGHARVRTMIRWALALIRESAQRRRPGRSYEKKCRGRYGRWKNTKNAREKAKRDA